MGDHLKKLHNLAEAKLAEALALEKQGMFAAASVLLTMEQIQVSKGIDGAGVEATNENLVAIKKCFEQMHTVEARCRDQAKLRMQVFGMLYKQGHDFRKDLKLRLWVMDGMKLSYYELGDPKPKGSLMVHSIRTVEKYTFAEKKGGVLFKLDTVDIEELGVKDFALEVTTYGETAKNFVIVAPDAHSRDVWQDALEHKIEDNVLMQTDAGWQKRWLVVHKSEIAVFETPGGETIGIIELKKMYPGSLKPVDDVDGKSHCFALETTDQQFVLSAADEAGRGDWIKTLGDLSATRGSDEHVGAYLAAVKSGTSVEADGGSSSAEETYLASLSASLTLSGFTLSGAAPATGGASPKRKSSKGSKIQKTVDVKHPLYKTIVACEDAADKAREHAEQGFVASASVQFTLMLVHAAEQVASYPNQDEKEVLLLRALFDKLKDEEDRLKTLGQREMLVYGMLYKKGQKRKNWNMRLYVLDSGTISYYQLGDDKSKVKGSYELSSIMSVDTTAIESKGRMQKLIMLGMDDKAGGDGPEDERKPWKKFTMTLKLEGHKEDYYICAPNKESQETWVSAFKPVFKGPVLEYTVSGHDGTAGKFEPRMCIIHKSQMSFFEHAPASKSADGGTTERGPLMCKISLKNVQSIAMIEQEGHKSCCAVHWTRESATVPVVTKIACQEAGKLVHAITHLIEQRAGVVKETTLKLANLDVKMKPADYEAEPEPATPS